MRGLTVCRVERCWMAEYGERREAAGAFTAEPYQGAERFETGAFDYGPHLDIS